MLNVNTAASLLSAMNFSCRDNCFIAWNRLRPGEVYPPARARNLNINYISRLWSNLFLFLFTYLFCLFIYFPVVGFSAGFDRRKSSSGSGEFIFIWLPHNLTRLPRPNSSGDWLHNLCEFRGGAGGRGGEGDRAFAIKKVLWNIRTFFVIFHPGMMA